MIRESIENILRPKSKSEIEQSIKDLTEAELIELVKDRTELLDFVIKRNISPLLYGELLKWVVEKDDIKAVRKILDNVKDIPSTYISQAISIAIKKNIKKSDILSLLLADKRLDPSLNRNNLIRWASSAGHTSLVKELMNDPRVDPSDVYNGALLGADVYEHKDIVKLLLKDKRVRDKLSLAQMKKFGVRESIGDFLKPKSQEDVKKAALEIKDPNELLRIAINKIGDHDLVRIAIERGADPNKISGDVSNIKNLEIIRILLTNPQTKISPNSLVYKALKFGMEDEVIKLIKDEKLNPGAKNSVVLVWSVGFGLENLTKVLLKDDRVNPESEEESIAEALSIAIARGNDNLVKILTNDSRINVAGDNDRPLKVAAQFGNVDALKILLKNSKVDPSREDLSTNKPNFAIEQAAESLKNKNLSPQEIENYKEIISLLIADKRVRNKLSKAEIKNYESMKNKIVRESLVETVAAEPAQPTTKPGVKPGVKPGTKPGAPSPIRRERPSVTPKPKATADDVAEKFLGLIEEE